MRSLALALALAFALAFALAAVPVQAACGARLDVHARHGVFAPFEDPRAAGGAAVCASTPYTESAERILLPSVDEVAAHYEDDFGPNVTTLTVTFLGLGFANDTFSLVRTIGGTTSFPEWSYRMPYVALPGGTATSGSLTATVTLPSGTNVTGTFRVAP